MKKLISLRDHILTSALEIPADQLMTFAEDGEVTSFRGAAHVNSDFGLSCRARLIITNYVGDIIPIFVVILDWVRQHAPDALSDDLKFEIDHLDHSRSDITVTLPLYESVTITPEAGGRRVTSDRDPDHRDLNMWLLTGDGAPS